MIRNGSNGHGNASGSGSWLGGVGRGGQKDQVDEWELERRARMEQVRDARVYFLFEPIRRCLMLWGRPCASHTDSGMYSLFLFSL